MLKKYILTKLFLLAIIIVQAIYICCLQINYNKLLEETKISYTGHLGDLSSILLIYERGSIHDCEDAKSLTEMLLKVCVDRISDKNSIIDPLEDTESQLNEAYRIATKFVN